MTHRALFRALPAIVEFMHYAERLHRDAVSGVSHAEREPARPPGSHQH